MSTTVFYLFTSRWNALCVPYEILNKLNERRMYVLSVYIINFMKIQLLPINAKNLEMFEHIEIYS